MNRTELSKHIKTISELCKAEGSDELLSVLKASEISVEQTGHDNWNGGIDLYTVYCILPVNHFVQINQNLQNIESEIEKKFDIVLRTIDHEAVSGVVISPKTTSSLSWEQIADQYTKDGLIADINFLKD